MIHVGMTIIDVIPKHDIIKKHDRRSSTFSSLLSA